MELKDIKLLIDLMRKNDLSVFKMEQEGFKITLKRGNDFQPVITTQPIPQNSGYLAPAPPAHEANPASAAKLKEIVSPMVGTFYTSASPESQAYVQPGQEVTPDTVVCIIEAMKVMNEIKAEVSGTIAELCVENGKPVQYGQPLFKVK